MFERESSMQSHMILQVSEERLQSICRLGYIRMVYKLEHIGNCPVCMQICFSYILVRVVSLAHLQKHMSMHGFLQFRQSSTGILLQSTFPNGQGQCSAHVCHLSWITYCSGPGSASKISQPDSAAPTPATRFRRNHPSLFHYISSFPFPFHLSHLSLPPSSHFLPPVLDFFDRGILCHEISMSSGSGMVMG